MSPLDAGEAQSYYGHSGKFMTIREIQPGNSMVVRLQDISKNFKTKYPMKDKDYNYRVTLTDASGQLRWLDLNGASAIRQFVTLLYAQGPDKPPVPCQAKLTRRAQRKTNESELLVEQVDEKDSMESDG